MIDGQPMQFGSGSSAFPRPPNPAWPRGLLDLNLYNCGRPPIFTVAVYDGSPSPGRYEVGGELQIHASLQSPNEGAWEARADVAGSSGGAASPRTRPAFDLAITSVDVCR
jgi:hypothetical protein